MLGILYGSPSQRERADAGLSGRVFEIGGLACGGKTGLPAVALTPIGGTDERWIAIVSDEQVARALLRVGPPERIVEHAIHVQAVDANARTVRTVVAGNRPVAAWALPGHGFPSHRLGWAFTMVTLVRELLDLTSAASEALGRGLLSLDVIEPMNSPATVDRVRSTVDSKEALQRAGEDVERICSEHVLAEIEPGS